MKKITFLFVMLFSLSFCGQDALNTAEHQFLENGVWKVVHKNLYTYDSSGNLLSDSFLRRNDADTGWINHELFLYTYDSSNKLIEKLLKMWDTNLGTPGYVENLKTVYTYNSGNKLAQYVSYFMINDVWTNDMKVVNTFNSEGVKVEEISYFWRDSEWQPSNRNVIELDSNNMPSTVYIEGWSGTDWIRSNYKLITYNSENKIVLEVFKQLVDQNYVEYSKNEFTYDVHGNLLNKKVYHIENGAYVYGYGEVYTFDLNYLLNAFLNPFEDSTGLEYEGNGIPFVNKVMSVSYSSTSKIIYTYGEATAGVKDIYSVNIKTIPNPTKGLVIIKGAEFNKVVVFNILGKKILSTKHAQIDLSNYSKGVYLFKIYDNIGRVAVKKIIKH